MDSLKWTFHLSGNPPGSLPLPRGPLPERRRGPAVRTPCSGCPPTRRVGRLAPLAPRVGLSVDRSSQCRDCQDGGITPASQWVYSRNCSVGTCAPTIRGGLYRSQAPPGTHGRLESFRVCIQCLLRLRQQNWRVGTALWGHMGATIGAPEAWYSSGTLLACLRPAPDHLR